jgi:hypothetical protein
MTVSRKMALVALVWSLINLVVWIGATVYVQTHSSAQHSLAYLTFVSNYALVSSSFAGVVAALSALWSENSG